MATTKMGLTTLWHRRNRDRDSIPVRAGRAKRYPRAKVLATAATAGSCHEGIERKKDGMECQVRSQRGPCAEFLPQKKSSYLVVDSSAR